MRKTSRTGGNGGTPRGRKKDAAAEAVGRAPAPPPDADDEVPGVPAFASWRSVYGFVFAVFVVTVIALAIFSRVFA